jgi:hypothetical protein
VEAGKAVPADTPFVVSFVIVSTKTTLYQSVTGYQAKGVGKGKPPKTLTF